MDKIKNAFNLYLVDVLKNHYADFNGRATRTQFWMFNLFIFIASFIIALIAGIIRLPVLSLLFVLAVLIPSIAIDVRRIRDLGISPWWILVVFVPFIGGVALLVAFCLPTDSLKQLTAKVKK